MIKFHSLATEICTMTRCRNLLFLAFGNFISLPHLFPIHVSPGNHNALATHTMPFDNYIFSNFITFSLESHFEETIYFGGRGGHLPKFLEKKCQTFPCAGYTHPTHLPFPPPSDPSLLDNPKWLCLTGDGLHKKEQNQQISTLVQV